MSSRIERALWLAILGIATLSLTARAAPPGGVGQTGVPPPAAHLDHSP